MATMDHLIICFSWGGGGFCFVVVVVGFFLGRDWVGGGC